MRKSLTVGVEKVFDWVESITTVDIYKVFPRYLIIGRTQQITPVKYYFYKG